MVVKILKKIDKSYLNGFFRKKYHEFKYGNEVKKKTSQFKFKTSTTRKKSFIVI